MFNNVSGLAVSLAERAEARIDELPDDGHIDDFVFKQVGEAAFEVVKTAIQKARVIGNRADRLIKLGFFGWLTSVVMLYVGITTTTWSVVGLSVIVFAAACLTVLIVPVLIALALIGLRSDVMGHGLRISYETLMFAFGFDENKRWVRWFIKRPMKIMAKSVFKGAVNDAKL